MGYTQLMYNSAKADKERKRRDLTPGKQAMIEWRAALEKAKELREVAERADAEAQSLYRKMVTLGREEGWHV